MTSGVTFMPVHHVTCTIIHNILTAGVPFGAFRLPFAAQAPLHVGQGVAVGRQHLSQQRYVRDRQPQRVDLAQPLLVRERRDVSAELVERRVDAAKHQQRFVIRPPFSRANFKTLHYSILW